MKYEHKRDPINTIVTTTGNHINFCSIVQKEALSFVYTTWSKTQDVRYAPKERSEIVAKKFLNEYICLVYLILVKKQKISTVCKVTKTDPYSCHGPLTNVLP